MGIPKRDKDRREENKLLMLRQQNQHMVKNDTIHHGKKTIADNLLKTCQTS
jgi:hypothetical protein